MVDILIIGSGIAGLYASLQIPKDKSCLIITKSSPWNCNSFYAQGGIATAVDKSDIQTHIEDTLKAGSSYGDRDSIKVLSENSLDVIDEFISRGFEFDKNLDGSLAYTKEGAHSRNRILHADGDATGRMMHLFLMRENIHPIQIDTTVVDFLIKDKKCYGVEVLKDGEISHIYAKSTIIASGGVGTLYRYNTNDRTISGEIHGIALSKGIELKDMELLQFHPTSYISKKFGAYLLTEALRGEGALVVDEDGYQFLFEYDSRGELAPRDIVSRAIFNYKQKSKKRIYLSFKNFSKEFFRERFPNIYRVLRDFGFNVPAENIEISPAFHYAMGGIKTNLYGKVPNIKNLYAIGEVASTGVHGANRLASNSLLEALVFSKRAIESILSRDIKLREINFKLRDRDRLFKKIDSKVDKRLRKIMWKSVGIIRERKRLKEALKKVDRLLEQNIGDLMKYRLFVAKNIIQSAIEREKSLGAHYILEKE